MNERREVIRRFEDKKLRKDFEAHKISVSNSLNQFPITLDRFEERQTQQHQEILNTIFQEIPKAVEVTVNGKIKDLTKILQEHNLKHESDMEDLRPIITAFKEQKAVDHANEKLGDKIIKYGSVGSAGLVIIYIIKKIFGI